MGARRFALLIGNSEYDDVTLARLTTPSQDVVALCQVLRASECGGFDDVTVLLSEPAAAIRRAVGKLFSQKKRDDLLLLYFSGHGLLDDFGDLFLASKDTDTSQPSMMRETAIPATDITHQMDCSDSRSQVLILDCCHSAAFAKGAKGAAGGTVGTATAFAGNGFGRVVLTATDATQFAWEGDQVVGRAETSVFTHFVVEGLKTGVADADRDGWISLDELYDYASARVIDTAGKQTPRKFVYNQQGSLRIARSPIGAGIPTAVPAPPEPVRARTVRLDPRPVTNAQFLECIRMSRIPHPSGWAHGTFPNERADGPVTGVSWEDALACAASLGKRLPTADEWDRAAGNFETVQGLLEWTATEVPSRSLGNAEPKRALRGNPGQTPRPTSAHRQDRFDYVGFRCATDG